MRCQEKARPWIRRHLALKDAPVLAMGPPIKRPEPKPSSVVHPPLSGTRWAMIEPIKAVGRAVETRSAGGARITFEYVFVKLAKRGEAERIPVRREELDCALPAWRKAQLRPNWATSWAGRPQNFYRLQLPARKASHRAYWPRQSAS